MKQNYGQDIYNLAKKLYPLNRSITGAGVRDTLKMIDEEIGGGEFKYPRNQKWHTGF